MFAGAGRAGVALKSAIFSRVGRWRVRADREKKGSDFLLQMQLFHRQRTGSAEP
jgi:hypothetical protein